MPFVTADENRVLKVSGHPFRSGDEVEFSINNETVLTRPSLDGEEEVSIPILSRSTNVLTINIQRPTSPIKLDQSEDA